MVSPFLPSVPLPLLSLNCRFRIMSTRSDRHTHKHAHLSRELTVSDMTPWAELEWENGRKRQFSWKDSSHSVIERTYGYEWLLSQCISMKSLRSFRCFSLYVRCINTRTITLYSRILFHSQRSHLHMSPHFINQDQFQHTWQHMEKKRLKEWEDAHKHKVCENMCTLRLDCVFIRCRDN